MVIKYATACDQFITLLACHDAPASLVRQNHGRIRPRSIDPFDIEIKNSDSLDYRQQGGMRVPIPYTDMGSKKSIASDCG